MMDQTDLPNISLPLQSHSDITEERRERPALRPLDIANAKRQRTKASYDHERDPEHIERIGDEYKPTRLEVQRSSFSSSNTVDTVEFVRKIATGDRRKLPITTTITTTEKPKPARPKRWFRRIGVLCSIFALLALIIIPVVCVCILTGVFVPDEARTKHGKVEQATTKASGPVSPTTIHTTTATTASHSSLQSTEDPPDVTWLATPTKTGPRLNAVTSAADADHTQDHTQDLASKLSLQARAEVTEAPTTMETWRVKPSSI